MRKNCLSWAKNDETSIYTRMMNNSWIDNDNDSSKKSILNDNTRKNFRNEYFNERNFCDDDIYRNLRLCQIRNNVVDKHRWLTKLFECKRKNFKQLQRKMKLKFFIIALNELLKFVKFWSILQIKMFNRILNLKCFDVNRWRWIIRKKNVYII